MSWETLSLAERGRINYEIFNIRLNYWVTKELNCKIHGHKMQRISVKHISLDNQYKFPVYLCLCKKCKVYSNYEFDSAFHKNNIVGIKMYPMKNNW